MKILKSITSKRGFKLFVIGIISILVLFFGPRFIPGLSSVEGANALALAPFAKIFLILLMIAILVALVGIIRMTLDKTQVITNQKQLPAWLGITIFIISFYLFYLFAKHILFPFLGIY